MWPCHYWRGTSSLPNREPVLPFSDEGFGFVAVFSVNADVFSYRLDAMETGMLDGAGDGVAGWIDGAEIQDLAKHVRQKDEKPALCLMGLRLV
jgi:hypothetical protein